MRTEYPAFGSVHPAPVPACVHLALVLHPDVDSTQVWKHYSRASDEDLPSHLQNEHFQKGMPCIHAFGHGWYFSLSEMLIFLYECSSTQAENLAKHIYEELGPLHPDELWCAQITHKHHDRNKTIKAWGVTPHFFLTSILPFLRDHTTGDILDNHPKRLLVDLYASKLPAFSSHVYYPNENDVLGSAAARHNSRATA